MTLRRSEDESRGAGLRRVLWTLFALAGCIPVQSVVGRPAAVMAAGDQRVGLGVGGVYFDGDPSGEHLFLILPYPHFSFAQGLGNNLDWEVAGWIISNSSVAGQFCLRVRKQFLGEPYVTGAPDQYRTEPVDASIELGGSLSGIDPAVYADFYLGVNASVPLSVGATPYVSYRYHWGILGDPFEMQMLFLGVEFTISESGARVCVEAFHGFPPERETDIWRTWGCNVLYRTGSY